MKLSTLLSPWSSTSIDCDILDLQNDSRQIKPGELFIAYPGAVADGRNYIQQAIQQGAAAIIYEPNQLTNTLPTDIPCLAIPQLASKLAAIASRFYEHPTQSLTITGVTGTNGKTTIAYQLAQAHTLLGKSANYIGTLGQGNVHDLKPLMNTTPDALCLQRLFHAYHQATIQHVCMEVSSHALQEQRVAYIDFNQAIYTNLTHDHLDYHHNMESYAAAKAMLFAMPTLKWAIINQDDSHAMEMDAARLVGCQKITYGINEPCDVRAVNCQFSMTGSEFDVHSSWGLQHVKIKSLGAFNVYNSLAVYSSLLAHGYPVADVVNVMAKLNASPGRMEVVAEEPCVIVDYAHTPDALENVLSTLVHMKKANDKTARKIWVVFGCGGDRDTTKRPVMGRIASELAEQIIITSDNPRSEEPGWIIEEIVAGVSASAHVTQIIDRKEAIHHALERADKQDIILIAGKGHEAYQQIGHQRFDFSDQAVVREFFDKKHHNSSQEA